MQEGNRLHYLADRACIAGIFSEADLRHLDQAFPVLLKQLELMVVSGELNPHHQHYVTLYAKGLTSDADTDRHGFSAEAQSPLISSIDILLARKATGLMTRNGYKVVTDITTGKYREVQP